MFSKRGETMPLGTGRKRQRTGRDRAGELIIVFTLLLVAFWPARAVAAGLQTGLLSNDPVWTDKPVRIDRKKQNYERIVIEKKVPPFSISVSANVNVFDSASFQDKGRIYVLTGAIAVHPKRLCRSSNGVSACGQQARLYLKRLISRRTLECSEDFRVTGTSFLTCRLGEADVSETLVGKGAAWAATPALKRLQDTAMYQELGIWTDGECRQLQRCRAERKR
jgi:hypothetical protein